MPNIEIVRSICALLDELHPDSPVKPHAELIRYVQDRPGHDRRYAIDARKIEHELSWRPAETFASGIRKSVAWYLEHGDWVAGVTSGDYRKWMDRNYGERSGA
jgi:dTDP-glucose 4,6-dehydratase